MFQLDSTTRFTSFYLWVWQKILKKFLSTIVNNSLKFYWNPTKL